MKEVESTKMLLDKHLLDQHILMEEGNASNTSLNIKVLNQIMFVNKQLLHVMAYGMYTIILM